MKNVVRNDQYGHGKMPDLILNAKFVQMENKRENKK